MSDVLFTILEHPSLQELEIDGRPSSFYEERILPKFTSLRRIKLIVPTPPVLEVLPEWLESLVSPLQNLSIVYKVDMVFDLCPVRTLSPRQHRLPLLSQMLSLNRFLNICPV